MLLHEYLDRSASVMPDKVALVCGPIRKTYAEIARDAGSFAAYLLNDGLRKGDRVAVFHDNSVELVVAVFGILKAGGCMVVTNPATQFDRLTQILENCEPRFLLTSTDKLAVVGQVLTQIRTKPTVILTGEKESEFDAVRYNDVLAHVLDGRMPNLVGADLAGIIYTSGSTGKPKGVTHLHLSIDLAVESVAEYLGNTPQDVILNVLPLSSSYGLLQLLTTFRTGACLILERGLGLPYELISLMKRDRVTGLAGAPTIWAILLKLEGLEKEDLSHLRYITNAAAALPASFIPRLQRAFPSTKIFLMHGLTECLRTTYLPPDEITIKPTSVGCGMRNVELWIEDEDGKRLEANNVGEMIVRGPTLMVGYWRDPEATAKALIPGPYPWERVLRTKDLFSMDSEGYFHFVARSDELVKCKGEKVSPIEVEDVIYTLDGVLETRVIGIPHEIFGQAIRAEIVLKEGANLTIQDVKLHCRQLLEDFKVPQTVVFVSSLPKTAGGKIRRTA